MLIIAAPKTVSTSIALALSRFTGTLSIQVLSYREKNGTYSKWESLPHSDMAELSSEELKNKVKSIDVYKQHLIPIKEHHDILNNLKAKVVVLNREPKEIYEAYLRYTQRDKVKNDKKEIMKQLENFCSGLKEIYQNDKAQYLHISYDEIIESNYKVMKNILDFWNINVPLLPSYQLPKMRYSRDK